MSAGGFWNRAGRRSGGDRPLDIVLPTEIVCGRCRTTTPFGLLPRVALWGGDELARCPTCGGILFAKVDGEWMTGNEISAAADAQDRTEGA